VPCHQIASLTRTKAKASLSRGRHARTSPPATSALDLDRPRRGGALAAGLRGAACALRGPRVLLRGVCTASERKSQLIIINNSIIIIIAPIQYLCVHTFLHLYIPSSLTYLLTLTYIHAARTRASARRPSQCSQRASTASVAAPRRASGPTIYIYRERAI
jgi:hypothetical protein